VVIGGSAGSIPVLEQILGGLPAELPVAVLVVVHQAQTSPGMLPQMLSRAGRLPAQHAQDGEPLVAGRVYVAPPDRHLLVEPARDPDGSPGCGCRRGRRRTGSARPSTRCSGRPPGRWAAAPSR
jgi:chemotaxis response regulator CheB